MIFPVTSCDPMLFFFSIQPNPEYLYKFQVSDDYEQTYLAQDENRDGDEVNGQYSFVDPNGSLITVKYTAGTDGYNEVREVQEDFVTISDKSNRVKPEPKPVPRRPKPESDDDLVARIIAQLTPHIKKTVSESLGQ